MRILVCGGREYNDWPHVRGVLDALAEKHSLNFNPDDNWLPSDIVIIEGGATGADQLAATWAMVNCAQLQEFKADWKRHGRAAGALRNQLIIEAGKPDLVVAFPGGKGTANMIECARKAGVEVQVHAAR